MFLGKEINFVEARADSSPITEREDGEEVSRQLLWGSLFWRKRLCGPKERHFSETGDFVAQATPASFSS